MDPNYSGRGGIGRAGRSFGRGSVRGTGSPAAQQSTRPSQSGIPPAAQQSTHPSSSGIPPGHINYLDDKEWPSILSTVITPRPRSPRSSWPRPPPQSSAAQQCLLKVGESSSGLQKTCVPSTSVSLVNEQLQSSTQSTEQLQSSLAETSLNVLCPINRPDRGGSVNKNKINIRANYFEVRFNVETIIIHYDVDIQPTLTATATSTSTSASGKLSKMNLRTIKEKLFSDNPSDFPLSRTAYDGEKNIFSAVPLTAGKFTVEVSDGQDRTKSYEVTLKEVNQLPLERLEHYIRGEILSIPRDVIQSMELVLKENPSKFRIPIGRSFFPTEYGDLDKLGYGTLALHGFQTSLKPTQQGADLCLDYTVLPFHEPLLVIDLLHIRIHGFNIEAPFSRFKKEVQEVLIGLKVRVTHRNTKQKYTIAALTSEPTRNLFFDIEDQKGIFPEGRVGLVQYFRKKYKKEIKYQNLPCLDVGRNNSSNYVPMEFCIIAEGQRFSKDLMDQKNQTNYKLKQANQNLKDRSLVDPSTRMGKICEMVQANDGPCGGDVVRNFGMEVIPNMKNFTARVLGPPSLKHGLLYKGQHMKTAHVTKMDENYGWNLVDKSVVEGIAVKRWALLDFTAFEDKNHLNRKSFVNSLITRCINLGINMERPLLQVDSQMNALNDVRELQKLIQGVIDKCGGRLQIILCAMTMEHQGYNNLKFVTDIRIGVVTQCFLSVPANGLKDQYLANLAIKINAKLEGCNIQLNDGIPGIRGSGHVMFIGADVNHPGAGNRTCPSIAAVVASMNWPNANRYAGRVCPQSHRNEHIERFGAMCLDLINAYEKMNKVKPEKIIVFRDGVSEGQFEMVLNKELKDLQSTIKVGGYSPKITVVVAQKRHSTRLFLVDENINGGGGRERGRGRGGGRRGGGGIGNVPAGTVVDNVICHPFEFDFFLASHQGLIGTSKATHYYVLFDEIAFSSDQIQVLIYHLCFTFARSTRSVSLVPPVYYADLMAYRGRLYQQVLTQLHPPPSSSSSVMSEDTDYQAYKPHPSLENMMYYI